jgi:phosphoribosylformylglycinamidine synthase
MGRELGAVVDLDDVPLKYAGLRYDEIWISEAQERMVFAVPPERLDRMLAVFAEEEVEATVIGTFTDDRWLRVRCRGQTVGELQMGFLHDGYPRQTLTATWTAPTSTSRQTAATSGVTSPPDPNAALIAALSEYNTASKEWIIRQYDHEVQGRSVIKPLVGPGVGPSDAAVLRPVYDGARGVAIGCGLCPQLGDDDPYLMAVVAVDEALRNVICVGANPDHTAILDNFCWPKVDTEESLGALVRTCCGARDAAIAFGLPFISGKDSLNNQFSMSAEEAKRTGFSGRIAIPYTLLVSALGVIEEVERCISMDLKRPGHRLVVASAPADRVGLDEARAMHGKVAALIREGRVRAAHDISDGGLAVAVSEMCIAANLGASVSVDREAFGDSIFAATATTYLLEMAEPDAIACGLRVVGTVEKEPRLRIEADGVGFIDLPVADLAEAWRSPLARGGGR